MYITERDGADEFFKILPSILMLIPIILAARLMMGSGGMMGGSGSSSGGRNIFQLGKAFPQGTKDLRVKTRFSDVAGLTQAKQEVVEFVDFLREPSKFEHLGARIPKGGLLVGPPGTGKTLLAKAVAGESGVPFFSMSGSDFIEMFVGVGPSRVRDLFAQARQAAPSIIFIDEIDAVGRKRGKGGFSGGANDERENTLNQILVEMDGFSSTTGVVVLAGTNRADILDPALIRPGRFDRQIAVDKPDLNDREAIFKVHLKPLTLLKGIDVTEVARRMAALTPGMTGADIANLCNEAAIYAARRSSSGVEMKDFEAATERIIGGLAKSNNLMSEQEKRTVAIHESGHAVAGWMMEFADPLLKVTIVPRSSGALGFAQYLPEELALYSKEALHDKLAVILGGRAAEELFTGRITTGAADDFAKATNIALGMAQVYGMTEGVGLLSWNPQQMQEMMYKPFSEKTAQTIESEARKIVENQYKRVKELLKANEAKVKALSVELFTKETLVFNDLQDVLGPRPYGINDKYLKYIDTRAGVEKDRQEATAAAAAATKEKAEEVHLNENSGIPMGEAKEKAEEQQPLTEASGIHHHQQGEEKEEGGGTQSSRTDDNHR
ncbi:cell division protein FtsH, putative [Perkinsus marinus ATCC 50983]|uniref:Cell division protein FtsH, putative n=2 Tax=Perkinsus marinus (strain ATCC 50983 / TXsc) TaxID=423536 RepID=C5KPE2_PERM5|nr:cell division protein FtsH, putative [Perkinsus marinus ATCC 50983]EER13651.1 cell division protein FtsH, putative [Perkinsus marinus ATCC 50983]|eukprot:XP_002781856.1 cell division protein FtsH, putative [Perkinsus marinus ATCC 50983]